MKMWFRRLAIAFAVLALCMPIGLMVVFLLYPLWRWLEATFGIESIGHSGPAPWCFAVVYVGLVIVATALLWMGRRQKRAAAPADI